MFEFGEELVNHGYFVSLYKLVRVIECKWSGMESKSHIQDVIDKKIEVKEGFDRLNILVVGYHPSKQFLELAKSKSVTIVNLDDFEISV